MWKEVRAESGGGSRGTGGGEGLCGGALDMLKWSSSTF